MNNEQKRTRHAQYFQPLEKGEGGYLSITAPISDDGKFPYALPPARDPQEWWLCPDYRVKRAEAAAHNTFYGLDAMQHEFVNLGPGVQAALVGAPYEIKSGSIWFDTNPPLKDWDNHPVFVTNPEHELYKTIEEQTRALCAASQGRYAVSLTDIGGQLDVLFSLRGEDLLVDLIECPEKVIALQNHLDDEFLQYFWHLYNLIKPTGCGHTTWMPIVSPPDKPYYSIQCDFSVMISPQMFERFVLPSLDRVSREVGCGIYHLDGPGEIPHLDMLLSLEHVHAIQWTALPQGNVIQDFADELSLDIYRRTLAAGKKGSGISYRAQSSGENP
jgi:5-methyltetrahydrofolate--homocysteine methyltransferase